MSWLNLNQSLNSLKGQITSFASEVLSEGTEQNTERTGLENASSVKDLEDKCLTQEIEIQALKKLTEDLQASLEAERLSKKNGVKEDESSWYWDPPPQTTKELNNEVENQYKLQIRSLQDELSSLKDREVESKPHEEEELQRLREENLNLTNNLEDLDVQHQLAMERLISLKKELEKNFEILKQEHEGLKNSNDDYSDEIKDLLLKIGDRDKEIEDLKLLRSDYSTLQHKHQNLERLYSLLRDNAEKFQEENQELHEEVFKLQEQVTKLEHDVEVASKHSQLANVVSKETYDNLIKELDDIKHRRTVDRVYLDEINIDDNAKGVIETLKRDINELKHKLTQKDTEEQNHSEQKSIKSEKIMILYNKYINFDLPVDYVGDIPSSDDGIILYKLESVFKTLSSFKKEMDLLEHNLSEKTLHINNLKSQIDDLTTENDFLTTDAQHYERELNEMKKNNDFLLSEITSLKNTSKLEPIIETHEDNIVKLESELADCNKLNKTFESEIKRIENELREVTEEKLDLKQNLTDLREKYTTMMLELEMCKTQSKAVEELEHFAGVEYQEKIKKVEDQIEDLKKQLHGAITKNEQLSIDYHIVENDKVLLTKEIDDLKNMLKRKSSEQRDLEMLKQNLEVKVKDMEDQVLKYEECNSKRENRVAIPENSNTTVINAEIDTEISLLRENLLHVNHENSLLMEADKKLRSEVISLKESFEKLSENHTSLQQLFEESKLASSNQDLLNKEISVLKDENLKVIQRKDQLELELTSTDNKILKLEQDFDKLITDLSDKDVIIDEMNLTISNKDKTISDLNTTITDLNKTMVIKNQEIDRLNRSFVEISDKLRDTEQSLLQLNKLRIENEELLKHKVQYEKEVEFKITEILIIKEQVKELEQSLSESKYSINSKNKEIKELNQSLVELTDKLKSVDNNLNHNDELAKLSQEKETLRDDIVMLQNNLTIKEHELTELANKCEEYEKSCVSYKNIVDSAVNEKNELINLINLKHNESIQYHNEIQRLNKVLLDQTNEFKKIVNEKDSILQNYSSSCANCEMLRTTLKEKDDIIIALNQNVTDYDKVKHELLNSSEVVKILTEKCDNLERNSSVHVDTIKKLTADNLQLSEQEQNCTRELERLRHHLVEMEENYTQELMTSEQKLTECQTRLHQVEERAKQTSTVYTSNSIRANQEVETLRNQIRLLEKQREEVQTKLSDAEDARSRSEAAVINLQVVLEQFQLDKERDINAATEKIQNKMDDLKRLNKGLKDEISVLNAKLKEALAGLQAASRLGDQVETKTAQINDLKDQVRTLQISVSAAEERYHTLISNQQDKVDKNLVKNLVINFANAVGTSSNDTNRMQVLRVLSTVLDFNQQECEKLGLVRSSSGGAGLAAEFVRFLVDESRPRTALPSMMSLSTSRTSTPSSRKNSSIGSPPTPQELGHVRNPSTGSNNLLFQNIDALETASQVSRDSEPRVYPHMDTGVNTLRNTEGSILKQVLKDM